MDTASVIADARHRAGLSQAELARRAGMTQPAIARLERRGANPRAATLTAVLRAAGYRLEPRTIDSAALDADQLRKHVAMSPAERLRRHHAAANSLRALRHGARRADSA